MPEHDPRVAVVMITYNRCDEALRSLHELCRLREQPRIVVVDNGSADGTARRIAQEFPSVDVVATGENIGGAGRNVGVDSIETPYVAFCDDDMWWEPDSLSRAADLLDAHPRVGALAARTVVGVERRDDPFCRELADSPLSCDDHLPGPRVLGFLAGAAVFRREAFREAGGFHRRFFVGGEEELLAIDLAANGWAICYSADLVVQHHPSPRRSPRGRNLCQLRNRLWVAWLRRPLGKAILRSIEILLQEPKDMATLRALGAALGGLPWVLRQRRVVPKEVERDLRLLESSPEPCPPETARLSPPAAVDPAVAAVGQSAGQP